MDPDIVLTCDPGLSLDTGLPFYDDPCASMNPASALTDDPGLNLEIESSVHDDLTTNTDETPSTQQGATVEPRCINCGSDLTQRRRHNLGLLEVASVIRDWISPLIIEDISTVCHTCWTLALNHSRRPEFVVHDEPSSSTGHRRSVCVNCGTLLYRTRFHMLHTDTERELLIRNTISEWIMPQQLQQSDLICHPCWQQTDCAANHSSARQHSINEGTIVLPNYSRAPDTHARCFVPECDSIQRLIVPKWLRIMLFAEHSFYVPLNCRICTFHLDNNNWQLLAEMVYPIRSFTAEHVQDFATFVNERQFILDFSNPEGMCDEVMQYWIELNKNKFRQLTAELPQLRAMHSGSLALAAYLLKLRTGDSDERIATLLNMPRTTLARLMNKARDMLEQDFIPRKLGINNITRAMIASRNLHIPNGLFGVDNRRPVVIMDGTYLYVQKRSNYLYQKDTYSLHKYRNLMKPFLIVCTDGYIVDVLGPYPATTSDATVLLNEFNDETKPLREYFHLGDVFILDRGFRDSVPLLRECGYSVHMPESVQAGESQMSTLAANKSRTVTICRWVVEAVNGIFKQSSQ